ncbi:MAG TPA: alpha/beta hydrolase [Vicinamibacteria bacterium]|nr:alpha/beta hydrolase [Vicinamibacteria bacterium]
MSLALAASLLASVTASPRSGTVPSADGVAIHYTTAGRGEPALVFVHGWAIDGGWWDAQVRAFSGTRRVVTLDLAGHGRSGRGRKDWTMAAFAEDVRAVVEALDLDRVVLVGHSMSGNVILEAARRLRGRVAGLIPVDTLLDVEQSSSEAEIGEALAGFRAGYAAAVEGFARAFFFTATTPPALVEEVVEAATSLPPAISVPILEQVWRHDPRPLLRDVEVPIVAVNADKFPTRLDHARRYAPQFDALFVEGVGHYLMREDPARFNAQLARAVARVTGTAAPDAPR